MTPGQWLAKADYEGGVLDAIFGYGLKETDLDEQSGEFYEAVKAIRALRSQIEENLQVIYRIEPDYEDEW